MSPATGVIDVSSGSSTAVETDELFSAAATLSALAADVLDWSHQASMARCVTQWSVDAARFGFAEPDLTRSTALLQETASGAQALGRMLEQAGATYAEGEQRNADASRLLAALGAFLAGGYVRHLALGALPLAPTAVAALLVAQHPEVRRLAALAGQPLLAALADHPELLESPGFVSLIRSLVSSADDFALGAAGVDPPIARLLGDDGAGVVGLSGMAGALLILAGRNAYTAAPIRVTRTSSSPVVAPRSLADAASRIPPSGMGRPQIRIERYARDGGDPSYAVYLAGTSDFSTGSAEPFDMGSNLAGIAGDDAAAYRATLDAMDAAGIERGDAVTLVGHSQGGLVAARVAASGIYDTEGLLTFGSPTGQIAVPDSVAHLAVEHAEDLTPALGGEPIGGANGRERIVVTRSLFDGAEVKHPIGSAHHMTGYAETAGLIDASDDVRLDGVKDAIARLGNGEGSSTVYRAEKSRG